MDFTLSLAHFCELHGPITILCTQALPASCSACLKEHTLPASSSDPPQANRQYPHRVTTSAQRYSHSSNGFDEDRCHSCRISLPMSVYYGEDVKNEARKWKSEPPHFRTKQEVHVCANGDIHALDSDGDAQFSSCCVHTDLESECHRHDIEYISSTSPCDPETFPSLRRATVRALSGEQLPRGHASGPLWFGDPSSGYIIAYIFRLPDTYARGRLRSYALLALVGTDAHRAFDACTSIWSFFEDVAVQTARMAEEVASREAADEGLSEPTRAPPVSSLLTGRATNPGGFSRHGIAGLRTNGIAELVNNEDFFCELHMKFALLLHNLGNKFGGMKVRPESAKNDARNFEEDSRPPRHLTYQNTDNAEVSGETECCVRVGPSFAETQSPEVLHREGRRHPTLISNNSIVAQRRQVAV